ncbi:hypothetical protein GCM10027447_01870 [Glycomyces halotolerans]
MNTNIEYPVESEAGSATVAELKARLEAAGVRKRTPSRLETLPKFLSVKETAEVLGVSNATVNNMIDAGKLPAVQFGGKGSRVGIPMRAINLIIDLAMITGGMVSVENWHEVLDDLVAAELIDARDKAALLGDPTAHHVNAGKVTSLARNLEVAA